MDVRSNIKNYLEKRGVSNTWLSKKTGISQAALSMTFNLKRELKADEYFSICSALKVPVNKFATRERDSNIH